MPELSSWNGITVASNQTRVSAGKNVTRPAGQKLLTSDRLEHRIRQEKVFCVSGPEREGQLLRDLGGCETRPSAQSGDNLLQSGSEHVRTFIGESERSRSSSRYELVAFQTKMTEMSRKRKYLSRASTVSQRLLRQSRTLGRETRGTDFLSRLYSIQLLAWKPCAYESHSSRYGSNAFTATSAVEGSVFWMNACRWGDLSIALASHGATRLISSYESSPARKTTGAVETRPRMSAQGYDCRGRRGGTTY